MMWVLRWVLWVTLVLPMAILFSPVLVMVMLIGFVTDGPEEAKKMLPDVLLMPRRNSDA